MNRAEHAERKALMRMQCRRDYCAPHAALGVTPRLYRKGEGREAFALRGHHHMVKIGAIIARAEARAHAAQAARSGINFVRGGAGGDGAPAGARAAGRPRNGGRVPGCCRAR